MTLARKTILSLSALTLGTVTAAGTAIWGLLSLQNQTAEGRTEYENLQQLRQIERQFADISLDVGTVRRQAVRDELRRFSEQLEDLGESPERPQSPGGGTEISPLRRAQDALKALHERLAPASDQPEPARDYESLINAAQRAMERLVDERENSVSRVHAETATRFSATLLVLVVLSATVLMALLWISLRYYSSVVEPLNYVRDAVRRMTRGDLAVRLT